MQKTAASPSFPCQNCHVRDKAICSALNDGELRELDRIASAVQLGAGGTAFVEGSDSTYLFNVVSGSLRLTKHFSDGRRQITGFLFPGDFLGLSVAGAYAYTAEALTETSLCRFDRRELAKVLEKFPKLEHRLLGIASNELAQAQDHLLVLGRTTATERVITVLYRLARRIGQRVDGGWSVELPMDRGDLADYTALTVETVSRAITNLRKEGIVSTASRRSFYLPDTTDPGRRDGDRGGLQDGEREADGPERALNQASNRRMAAGRR